MAMDNAIREHKQTPAGVYERLNRRTDEIRLIQVLPDDRTGRVACSIKSYQLAEAPKYTALSYTWGRPDRACRIEINGRDFPVRKNLLRFLCQVAGSLRHNHELFWIDALCIDQDDLDERTHQVGLMSTIYQRAEYVLAWLGPAYARSNEALRAIRRHNTSTLAKVWWTYQGAAICRLCHRAYWSRLWVLQELALARCVRLMCGQQEASWECFMNFMKRAEHVEPIQRNGLNHEYSAAMSSPAVLMLKQILFLDLSPSLFALMGNSRHLGCSDRRDRIFALLGIARLSGHAIVPDYTLYISRVLNMVLRDENQNLPPQSLNEVRERCVNLAELMDLPLDTILAHSMSENCHLQHNSGLLWADHYGHDDIKELWYREKDTSLIEIYFHQAAGEGPTRAFEILLHSGRVWVDCRNIDGNTALHLAAASGHYEAVRILLQHQSIDVNKQNADGSTALHLAATNGHYEIVCILHQHQEINVNKQNSNGNTALHLAAAKHGHEEIVRELLSLATIDVNMTDGYMDFGLTALHLAAEGGHTDNAKLLLGRSQTAINHMGTDGTALHIAAARGDLQFVELLLQHPDISVNQRDPGWPRPKKLENTALHAAIANGHTSVVRAFVEHRNVDVNSKDKRNGRTPLICAILNDREEVLQGTRNTMVELLLRRNDLDINAKDKAGNRAWDIAERYGFDDIVQLLLNTGKAKRSMKGRTRSILRPYHRRMDQ